MLNRLFTQFLKWTYIVLQTSEMLRIFACLLLCSDLLVHFNFYSITVYICIYFWWCSFYFSGFAISRFLCFWLLSKTLVWNTYFFLFFVSLWFFSEFCCLTLCMFIYTVTSSAIEKVLNCTIIYTIRETPSGVWQHTPYKDSKILCAFWDFF